MYCATALVERFDLNQFTTEMSFIHKTKKLRTCLYRVIKYYLVIILIRQFHLNGHSLGFHSQTQKVRTYLKYSIINSVM